MTDERLLDEGSILDSPDVIVDLDGDSATLVVAFGSMLGKMGGIPHFEFLELLRKFDVKRAFVRDRKALWYHGGVAGLDPTVAGLAAGLDQLVRMSSAERVVFLGSSSGGYAAILFACLVPVDLALAFVPQTFIAPGQRAAAGDLRWPRATQHVSAHLDSRYTDLRALLSKRERTETAPRVRLHYPAGEQLDAMHARHLAELPCVELSSHATSSHALPAHLQGSGRLEAIIARSISEIESSL